MPLSILVNKSLQTGIVPDNCKLAKVIPIYKAKEKNLFSNYRSISLLSVFSKFLEKAVHKRLYSFLETNKILYNNQFGFRKNHSTIDAIIKFVDEASHSLELKESLLAVFSGSIESVRHN